MTTTMRIVRDTPTRPTSTARERHGCRHPARDASVEEYRLRPLEGARRQRAPRDNAGGRLDHSLCSGRHGPEQRRRSLGEPRRGDRLRRVGRLSASRPPLKDAGVKRSARAGRGCASDGSKLADRLDRDQDHPLSDGQAPLLGVDVWGRVYWSTRSLRPAYLDAWSNTRGRWEQGRRALRRSLAPPRSGSPSLLHGARGGAGSLRRFPPRVGGSIEIGRDSAMWCQ